MNRFTVVLFCFYLFTHSTRSFGEGGVIGNGESLVRNQNGELVPADLYFKARKYVLPSSYRKKLILAENPKLSAELEMIERFVKTRSRNPKPFQVQFSDIEIYETERLSGKDLIPVGKTHKPKQVAYTFSFRQVSEEFNAKKFRRIIEIKPSVFYRLSLRNQALVLFHERLHQEAIGGHEVISPLIQTMSALLKIRDRQHAGDFSFISEKEFHTSEHFERMIKIFNDCDETVQRYDTACKLLNVDRKGGGILSSRQPHILVSDNFISVDSVVHVYTYCRDQVCDQKEFKNNKVLESSLAVDLGQPFIDLHNPEAFETVTPCESNDFTNIHGKVEVACGGSSNNKLEDIKSEGDLSSYIIFRDSKVRNVNQNLEVNHLSGIRLNNGSLEIRGRGNRVSDLTLHGLNQEGWAFLTFTLGSNNTVSKLELAGLSKITMMEQTWDQGKVHGHSIKYGHSGFRIDNRNHVINVKVHPTGTVTTQIQLLESDSDLQNRDITESTEGQP